MNCSRRVSWCSPKSTTSSTATRAGAGRSARTGSARWPVQKPFTPDSTTLFRYSALTFNGHRIHYDVDYCREVEGYDNLVVHGPLSATLLAGFAEEASGKVLHRFSYRGLRPASLARR